MTGAVGVIRYTTWLALVIVIVQRSSTAQPGRLCRTALSPEHPAERGAPLSSTALSLKTKQPYKQQNKQERHRASATPPSLSTLPAAGNGQQQRRQSSHHAGAAPAKRARHCSINFFVAAADSAAGVAVSGFLESNVLVGEPGGPKLVEISGWVKSCPVAVRKLPCRANSPVVPSPLPPLAAMDEDLILVDQAEACGNWLFTGGEISRRGLLDPGQRTFSDGGNCVGGNCVGG